MHDYIEGIFIIINLIPCKKLVVVITIWLLLFLIQEHDLNMLFSWLLWSKLNRIEFGPILIPYTLTNLNLISLFKLSISYFISLAPPILNFRFRLRLHALVNYMKMRMGRTWLLESSPLICPGFTGLV